MSRRKRKPMKLSGARLKALREAAGLSQLELSEKIGVSLRQVGRYEQNEAEPVAHTLAAMAKTLHCSSDYLLDLTDKTTGISPGVSAEERDFLKRFRGLPQNIRDAIMGLVFPK